ncbi:MAG: ATP-dependent helicase [Treponema sp.]|nr:ATP-dependent helicase [Treponema sp.]
MANPLPSYLEVLNPEQRQAVFHTGKPLLILAGAGSGKTRVITTKIAWLIREKGVDPRSILAVTFTNKAAREMADRAKLIDGRAGDAMLRTFHSFGAWFLRRNGTLAGLEPGFVIYDDDDSMALLGTIMEGATRAELRNAANNIARAKDYFISPDDPELDLINPRKSFREIYKKYEERLAKIGNVDFGDLIKKPVEILRSEPELARRIRQRFAVIMVDEYQDANVAQSELLKELYSTGGEPRSCQTSAAGTGAYICVVGDDDQSIYRFRGAEVKNILSFPEVFRGADIIRLERNYRSTAPILKAAASVVDHNKGRLGKTLKSERGDGRTPVLAFLSDQDAEAEFCAELIQKSVEGDKEIKSGKGMESAKGTEGARRASYADWAILYRTNAQSLGFETELLHRKIPYRVVGSLKFYEREEVKDTLALLSFLVNPRDEVAFRRMVNKPTRGLGPATVDRIVEEAARIAAREGGRGDLAVAARNLVPNLTPRARSGVNAFLKAIEAGQAALAAEGDTGSGDWGPAAGNPLEKVHGVQGIPGTQKTPEAQGASKAPAKKGRKPPKTGEGLRAGEGLSLCVVSLAVESGIAEYHLSNDEIAGNQRLNNLQEVANAASLYPPTLAGLLEFLEHIELDRSMEEASAGGNEVVTLITLHNTKGLEFRRVIMTGIEQGIFPRDDKEGEDLEEERRLFYVGATRAMDELYLTSCAERRRYGRTEPMEPSLFLGEIDRKALRIIGYAPRAFRQGQESSHTGSRGAYSVGIPGVHSARAPKKSSDGRWALGDRVYHDDHGYGSIQEIREGEDGPVIKVVFETGEEARFLSLHQSSNYTKIGED